jgi:hypothetical protein
MGSRERRTQHGPQKNLPVRVSHGIGGQGRRGTADDLRALKEEGSEFGVELDEIVGHIPDRHVLEQDGPQSFAVPGREYRTSRKLICSKDSTCGSMERISSGRFFIETVNCNISCSSSVKTADTSSRKASREAE